LAAGDVLHGGEPRYIVVISHQWTKLVQERDRMRPRYLNLVDGLPPVPTLITKSESLKDYRLLIAEAYKIARGTVF